MMISRRATTSRAIASLLAKPSSLFSSSKITTSVLHIKNRSFIVASFHSKNNQSLLQQQQENKNNLSSSTPSSQQQPNDKLFIYGEEKDLEKEIVPVEIFNDKERIMDDERPDINIPLFIKFWKMYFVRYAVISTAIFAVLWIVWEITDWLSSITFKNVATVSFYTGFFTGLISCGLGYLAVLACSISPSAVYKAAIKKVLANKNVRDNMLTPLTPGKFRAFSYTYPDYNNAHDVPLARKVQFWKPKRVQLIFQLQDVNKKTAMISCDASRKSGLLNIIRNRFTFHSLIVDIPDSDDRLILRGSDEDAVYEKESSSNIKLN